MNLMPEDFLRLHESRARELQTESHTRTLAASVSTNVACTTLPASRRLHASAPTRSSRSPAVVAES